jgi:CheY-like chemotaxis protein
VLGLTSYQEALRALGRLADSSAELRIVEKAEDGWLEVATLRRSRQLSRAELEDLVVASLARRGEHRPAGDVADLLRAVGQALDQLHALDVCLELTGERLNVRFNDRNARAHELTYAGDELEALRRAAAARRNGQPLRRILVLQTDAEAAAPLVELLVAEFAVQALPTRYARALADSGEPPDLVLAQVSGETLDALGSLRAGPGTAQVPILALAGAESDINGSELFAAGADDVLQEPVQPAQLRARLRTWLLRGRSGAA